MVNFMVPVLGLAAFASMSMAAPTASETVEIQARDFSFQDWINDIVENPNGDHLSPEEAYEAAKKDHQNEKRSVDRTAELFKRDVTCNTKPVASAPDAVSCINQIAAKGSEACTAGTTTVFCTIGNAQIVGVSGISGSTTSSCSDVARALGGIMDVCWRADNTVQGSSYAWGNGDMAVHISAPLV